MDPSQVEDPQYSYNDPQISYGPPPRISPYGQPPMPLQSPVSASNVTVVVNQQPMPQHTQLMATTFEGYRTWTTGIFDCFSDMGNCCFTMFCYPCAVASIASRTGECCCTPCCVPGTEIVLRGRIRAVGGIRGNMCDDCLVVSCCGPCAACQEARELSNMGIP